MRHFRTNPSPLWFLGIGLLLSWLQLGEGLPINSSSPNLPVSPKETNQTPAIWNSAFPQAPKSVEAADTVVCWNSIRTCPFQELSPGFPFPIPGLQGLISSWPFVGIPGCSSVAKELPFSLPNCLSDYHKLNTWVVTLIVFIPDLQKYFCIWKHICFFQPLLAGCVKDTSCVFRSAFVSFLWQLRLHAVVSAFAHWFLFLALKRLFWDLQRFLHWLIKPGLKADLLNIAFKAHK